MLTDQTLMQKEISGFRGFLVFWFEAGPIWFWNQSFETLNKLESIFAVRLMFQHLTEPIFQDYSRAGRLIGFFVRLFRIGFGLLFYLANFILFAFLTFI